MAAAPPLRGASQPSSFHYLHIVSLLLALILWTLYQLPNSVQGAPSLWLWPCVMPPGIVDASSKTLGGRPQTSPRRGRGRALGRQTLHPHQGTLWTTICTTTTPLPHPPPKPGEGSNSKMATSSASTRCAKTSCVTNRPRSAPPPPPPLSPPPASPSSKTRRGERRQGGNKLCRAAARRAAMRGAKTSALTRPSARLLTHYDKLRQDEQHQEKRLQDEWCQEESVHAPLRETADAVRRGTTRREAPRPATPRRAAARRAAPR